MNRLALRQGRWRNPLRFFSELLEQPAWVAGWVLVLMAINLAGLAFWSELLARVIVAIFLLSAMLMMGLYSVFGFERILGLGHVFWIPLLVMLLMHLPQAAGAFAGYLIVLALCLGISLLFDIRDLWIYVSQKRTRQ
ncbi:MAG: hypothetical protein KIT49_12245 [Nitrospira sp.]|nr:hypothetical protein [Fimbriimonadaceae bacterium]MBX3649211.1 hypothetical protein [Rhodocyclaceae bacterium]MCW5788250.1 hypothetical protein [Nitrospira sp.]